MWLPSADVISASPQQTQSIFINQLWHELLSPSSPDTFRARALDLPLLLQELCRVIEYAQQEPKWVSHIHAICEEIEDNSLPDQKLYAPPEVAASALRNISKFRGAAADLPRLREQAQIYLDVTDDYLPKLLKRSRELAGDAGNKKLLAGALKALATHVQARGLADESVAAVSDARCVEPPENAIDSLCEILNSSTREYLCFVAIAAPRSVASSLFQRFQECGVNRFQSSQDARDWHAAQPEGIVVEIPISASSRRQAAEIALSQVLAITHLHALYANRASLNCDSSVLILQGNDFYLVEVTPSRHFGLEPRRESEKLARLRFNSLNQKLPGRLSNLLESHALGVAANDARSAVVHMWTALETLASTLGSGGIGMRVANAISPIVAWRRTDKIVTYLAISITELAKHTGVPFDRTHMPKSKENHVDRSDLLGCLAGPTRNPGILAAFQYCGVSPLLTYRLFRAWEEFSDAKNVRKALERSHNRVRWQTLRFYRARNWLVHYGELDKLALRLLENAQYYVSTCVGRVLHDLAEKSTWDINTSLEYQRQRFESLLHRLRECPSDVCMGEVLVRTTDDVSPIALWGEKSRFHVAPQTDH